LPALRIYNQENNGHSVSFGRGSSFYLTWNSTIYLPKLANQLDKKIDTSVHSYKDKKSLRWHAIAILNGTSKGKISPKCGLTLFLDCLNQGLSVQINASNSPLEKTILSAYISVAERYQDHLSNGYPLLQKLCFRPIHEKVNKMFYMRVQKNLHNKLIGEMRTLQPKSIKIPSLPPQINLPFIFRKIDLLIGEKKVSKTANIYIDLCLSVPKIRKAVSHVLISLSQLPQKSHEKELKAISDIKGLKQKGLPETTTSLINAIETHIHSEQNRRPRNISIIILNLLVKIGHDLYQSQ